MERDSKPFDCRDPIPLLVALKNFQPECALATGKAVGLVSCLPVNARRKKVTIRSVHSDAVQPVSL